MSIEYSCICRGGNILVSHQDGYGSLESIINSLLPNIPTRNNGKTTYSSDNYSVHVLVENGILYICVADASFGKQKPYTYLAEIKRRFESGSLVSRAMTAGPNDLNREFEHVMTETMIKGSKGQLGQLSVLQNQVDEVKGVMSQNIEKVIDRGDKLEDLIDKTDELQAHSMAFQKTSKRINRKFWWKNTKMTIIMVTVGIVIVVVIVIIILFSTHILPPKSGSDSTTIAPVTTAP